MPLEQLNSIDLYYESNGEGPNVVFLHGAGGNHISWWQQVPTFRRAYRCISIDHRGFGRSLDETGEGAARFVDDLEAFIDNLGLDRVFLVAQSMGGRSALGYACRHPERVRALVMADTWGFFDWPEQQARARELAPATTTPLVHRALAEAYQAENPAMTFLYRQIQALNPPRDQTGLASGGPTVEDVRTMTVPTLCLVGADDRVTHPLLIRALADLLPDAEYVEVPDAGHSVYFELPGRFNELVGDFLARHGGNSIS